MHGLLEGTGYSIILYSSGIPDNLSEMLKGVLEGIVLEIISRGEIYGYESPAGCTPWGLKGSGKRRCTPCCYGLKRTSWFTSPNAFGDRSSAQVLHAQRAGDG